MPGVHVPHTPLPNTRKTYMLPLVFFFMTTLSHDCGFHMLMNAEYYDGRTVCNIQEGDMPRIRKILTHKWVTYDENDIDWEEMLNLKMTLKGMYAVSHIINSISVVSTRQLNTFPLSFFSI